MQQLFIWSKNLRRGKIQGGQSELAYLSEAFSVFWRCGLVRLDETFVDTVGFD